MTEIPQNEGIFASKAPWYWQAGLQVIPLKVGLKAPQWPDWTRFCTNKVSESEQRSWLASCPRGNIGLPAGPASGLIFIDVDTDDPEVFKVVESVVPDSPWKRVGKKGYVVAGRYDYSKKDQRKKQLYVKGSAKPLVEIMGIGSQIVLPPSIHPETKRPYTANAELYEVASLLPEFPTEIESILREAFINAGYDVGRNSGSGTQFGEWVPAGMRDNKMVAIAGGLTRDVEKGFITLQEAFNQMAAWVENFTEHVVGDNLDSDKGYNLIVSFLCRDVKEKNAPLPKGWDAGLSHEHKEKLKEIFSEEDEEWTADDARAYAGQMLRAELDDTHSKEKGVQYILQRLAKSPNITQMQMEILLKYVCDNVQIKGLTVAVLKKELSELKQQGIKGSDHTEVAKAALAEMQQYGEVKYSNNLFYRWNNCYWEQLDENSQILAVLAERFGSLPAARRRSDHSQIMGIMASLCSAPLCTSTVKGVNFANGYLTENLKLEPHSSTYGATYILPYRYCPELAGQCPKFFKLLQDAWERDPDYAEKVMALQEAMAAAYFGLGTAYQKCLLLYGRAQSGKSQLLRVMELLFPAEAKSAIRPENWGDRFSPTLLDNKLINICGELSEHKSLDGRAFKEIVDGTTMMGEFKGKNLFHFSPKCMHWFGSNYTPRSSDTSEGFLRRFLILKFNRSLPDDEKIPYFAEMIVDEEKEQIVAWALTAVLRLKEQNGYTLPKSHYEEIEAMAMGNDTVRSFLHESDQIALESRVPAHLKLTTLSYFMEEDLLYDEYTIYCSRASGVRPVSRAKFRKQIAEELGQRLSIFVHKERDEKGRQVWKYTGITSAGALDKTVPRKLKKSTS